MANLRVAGRMLVILVAAVIAACSDGPAGTFTPLIQPGPQGRYDLAVQNIPDIRGADLAPGASPARPVIDGKKATRKAHFITTYGGEVTAAEVRAQIEEGFVDAAFFTTYEYKGKESDGVHEIRMEYTFPGGTGKLLVELRELDRPNQLDFRYTVEEELE